MLVLWAEEAGLWASMVDSRPSAALKEVTLRITGISGLALARPQCVGDASISGSSSLPLIFL